MDLNKKYEENYNHLSSDDKKIVDESLQEARSYNHINVCTKCAKKYFVLPKNFDFTKDAYTISEDFFVDSNVAADTICECGDCQNSADYTVNLMEEET